MSAKKPAKRVAEPDDFEAYEPDLAANPGARIHIEASDNVDEILKAWEGTNWWREQNPVKKGEIDERIGISKEDQTVWKGWKHTAEVTRWVVPHPGGQGKVLHIQGSPVHFQKTVRCPHCKADFNYVSSTTVIKSHVFPPDVFPSTACKKARPKLIPAAVQGSSQSKSQSADSGVVAMYDLQDLAVRFLAVMALPFNFFSHPIVKLFLLVYRTTTNTIVTDRGLVREATCSAAARDRAAVLLKLKHQSVTVAVDGGTLHGRKLFGVGVVASLPRAEDERGWFWKLHTVLSQNNLSVSKRLCETLAIFAVAVIWVVCVVGDNHPGLQLGLRKAAVTHAFLVLRCACHSLQLLVKDILLHLPEYTYAKHLQDYVKQNLTPEMEARLPRKLVKFCETRWSTEHDSLESLFEMRFDLNEMFPTFLPPGQEQTTKWLCVKQVIDLLRIFKIATKVMEADSATMIDVVCVLVGLLHNLKVGGNGGVNEPRFYDALIDRIQKNFSSHAMMIVLFAVPGFLGHLVSVGLNDLAQGMVEIVVAAGAKAIFTRDQARYAHQGILYTTTYQDVVDRMQGLVDKWVAMSKLPFCFPAMFTSDSLLAFWAKQILAMGCLAEFVIAVLSCVPSEAIVERIFSHCKLIVDSCRLRMGEKATEDQSFVKFNDPKRYPTKTKAPSDESVARNMEELKSFPANWVMLVVLAHEVGQGLKRFPQNNGGDAEGKWKGLAVSDSDDSDAEDPGDEAEDEEDGDF